MQIPIGLDEQPWIEHPKGRYIDVVAIKMPDSLHDFHTKFLDVDLAKTDILCRPAMPISVIGYPLGITAGVSYRYG